MALGCLFFSFVYWECGFLRMSTTGLGAQSFSAREDSAVTAHMIWTLLLAVSTGIVLTVVHLPLLPLRLIGSNDEVIHNVRNYCHTHI